MRKIVDYKILRCFTTDGIQADINMHLKNGYELYGSPFTTYEEDHSFHPCRNELYYHQAMVKYEDENASISAESN